MPITIQRKKMRAHRRNCFATCEIMKRSYYTIANLWKKNRLAIKWFRFLFICRVNHDKPLSFFLFFISHCPLVWLRNETIKKEFFVEEWKRCATTNNGRDNRHHFIQGFEYKSDRQWTRKKKKQKTTNEEKKGVQLHKSDETFRCFL